MATMIRSHVSAPSVSPSPHLLHHLTGLRHRDVAMPRDPLMSGAMDIEIGDGTVEHGCSTTRLRPARISGVGEHYRLAAGARNFPAPVAFLIARRASAEGGRSCADRCRWACCSSL
jgi:hypothetical protein